MILAHEGRADQADETRKREEREKEKERKKNLQANTKQIPIHKETIEYFDSQLKRGATVDEHEVAKHAAAKIFLVMVFLRYFRMDLDFLDQQIVHI